ncbi:hypothetical protein evm_012133 [Chilo suppressalis]|nr:hypothetical protein evm_012133 [Chilo suppressalis]
MNAGFVKTESTNLPRIDALMVGEFIALNLDFCSAEQRNDKASIDFVYHSRVVTLFFLALVKVRCGGQPWPQHKTPAVASSAGPL